MSNALLVSVRLHEGWYHGSGGAPSPARIFQALVAGTGISGPLDKETSDSLKWLERQSPPIVGSPHTISRKAYINFVPNNDLDSKDGDYRRIGEIRTKKIMAPLLFDPAIPFLFAWKLEDDAEIEAAKRVIPIADRVYQLGRAVDMAWAWADLLSADELLNRLNDYPGVVKHPSAGSGDVDCPTLGSLESLDRRYLAGAKQFGRMADGEGQTFRSRPKPRWKRVSYSGIPSRIVLELHRSDDASFAPWPLERPSTLVEKIRDAAAERLRGALKGRIPEIDRVLIGRKPNGENAGPISARVRIIPMPSIGHPQADMQIRRILVEVPGACPVRADDIAWAVSSLRLDHPVLHERIDIFASGEPDQLRFFGIDNPARLWRSITPVILTQATRRRIDPYRKDHEAKSASEKHAEQCRASLAVARALRHAEVAAKVSLVRVQREPFDQRGTRAESFADGTRFSSHCLWHVELGFESPVVGPLLIGDGRFLGLGLMRPVRSAVGVFAFSVESGLYANPDPTRVAGALRRAVMARAQDVLGSRRLPSYFSGHPQDGSTVRSEKPHLAFAFDPVEGQLLVITPEHLDGPRSWRDDENLTTLELALQGFRELRAGADGDLRLRPVVVDGANHRLFRASRIWESLTPYSVNRHARKSTAELVLRHDILDDCERRGLPRPKVTVLEWNAKPGSGLQGRLRLEFKDAIAGLIILGKSRYTGGGVFAPLCQRT
jgi:CRISPR-associated protein Csb2